MHKNNKWMQQVNPSTTALNTQRNTVSPSERHIKGKDEQNILEKKKHCTKRGIYEFLNASCSRIWKLI